MLPRNNLAIADMHIHAGQLLHIPDDLEHGSKWNDLKLLW